MIYYYEVFCQLIGDCAATALHDERISIDRTLSFLFEFIPMAETGIETKASILRL
jgi:hypothetical protein